MNMFQTRVGNYVKQKLKGEIGKFYLATLTLLPVICSTNYGTTFGKDMEEINNIINQ